MTRREQIIARLRAIDAVELIVDGGRRVPIDVIIRAVPNYPVPYLESLERALTRAERASREARR